MRTSMRPPLSLRCDDAGVVVCGRRPCGQGRPREEIGESAVLARSGCAQSIGTTPLHPGRPLVMLSRGPIPSHVALDAGAGRRPLGAGSTPAAKSATAPSLRATRVPTGRQHSSSSPIQTLGHACSNAELEIAMFAPAAPKLKGPAVTFSFETGDADRRSALRCTV